MLETIGMESGEYSNMLVSRLFVGVDIPWSESEQVFSQVILSQQLNHQQHLMTDEWRRHTCHYTQSPHMLPHYYQIIVQSIVLHCIGEANGVVMQVT